MKTLARATLLVILILCAIHRGQPAMGQGGAAGRSARVNDIEMYYEERGAGEPLVLLHGFGGCPNLSKLPPTSPSPAQSPVPIKNEPRHHLKFENQYVRVFYVIIPPGETTLFHTHVNDGVGIKLADAQIRDEVMGGKADDSSVTRGAVGFTHYASPLSHRVINIGSTPFLNIFVEVLSSADKLPNALPLTNVAGHTMVLDNDRVRVTRMVLAPGQSTEVHLHALRGIGVAITEGKITVEVPGKKSKTMSFKPGDYQWHERGTKHSLRNVGSVPFEAIDIELK